MSQKRSVLVKIAKWHEAEVERFRCDWCQETFVFAAILICFCPSCGTEFDSEEDITEPEK